MYIYIHIYRVSGSDHLDGVEVCEAREDLGGLSLSLALALARSLSLSLSRARALPLPLRLRVRVNPGLSL